MVHRLIARLILGIAGLAMLINLLGNINTVFASDRNSNYRSTEDFILLLDRI